MDRDTGWHRHDSGAVHRDDAGCTWLGNPVPCDPPGAFLRHHEEQMRNPEYATAYRKAGEQLARSVERPCSEGNCVELYDPLAGEVVSGFGPVGCPCQDAADG